KRILPAIAIKSPVKKPAVIPLISKMLFRRKEGLYMTPKSKRNIRSIFSRVSTTLKIHTKAFFLNDFTLITFLLLPFMYLLANHIHKAVEWFFPGSGWKFNFSIFPIWEKLCLLLGTGLLTALYFYVKCVFPLTEEQVIKELDEDT
ncbi:MAG: hypothetical protein ACPLRU_07385, partial [Desulfofundulus sp.]